MKKEHFFTGAICFGAGWLAGKFWTKVCDKAKSAMEEYRQRADQQKSEETTATEEETK